MLQQIIWFKLIIEPLIPMYTCVHARNGKEGANDVKYIMKYQFKLSHDQGWNKRFTKLNVMQKEAEDEGNLNEILSSFS